LQQQLSISFSSLQTVDDNNQHFLELLGATAPRAFPNDVAIRRDNEEHAKNTIDYII